MIENETPRFGFPYLFVSQTSKELTHNEAIAAMDCLLHPVVEGTLNAPPGGLSQNDAGLVWRVGNSPSGIWHTHAQQIASWNGGGWRFFKTVTGMRVFDKQLGAVIVYDGNAWFEPQAVSNPTQGSIIDAEARSAISAILDILRNSGAIPE
jgi:hypothetical protein